MKLVHFILFFLLLVCHGLSRAQEIPNRPNTFNSKNQKTGEWVYYYNSKAKQVEKTDSIAFYRLISYQNGQPVGEFKEFYANGNPKLFGTLVAEEPPVYDGLLTSYGESGFITRLRFYENGQQSFNKAVASYEEALIAWPDEQRNSYALTIFLNNMGRLLRQTSHYARAEQIYLKSAEIRREVNGEQDSRYATALNSLASLYKEMGRYTEAEPLYLKSRDIYRQNLGEEHAYYATSLNNLALLYYVMGRYVEAEGLFMNAREIYRKNYGEKHAYYALSLSNLAGVYRAMGRYLEAESLYLKSREIYKVTWGEEHANYGALLKNMGQLYQEMGEFDKAEGLYLLSLEVRKIALGADHPHYAVTLNSLAGLYEEMARYNEAVPLYQQSQEIYQRRWGKEHPYYAQVLFNLAKIYQLIDPLNDSIASYLEKALVVNKKVFGEDSKDVIKVKKQLARYQYQVEKKIDLPLYKEMLNFYQNYLYNHFDYLGETERDAFYKTVKENYEEFIQLAFRQGSVPPELLSEVCNLQLQQKAILLNTSNQIKERILASGDRKLIDLYDEVESIRQRLGQIQSLEATSQIKFSAEQDSLNSLLRAKDQLLTQYSTYYRRSQTPATWQAIRDKLTKDEALVEIVRFRLYDYRYSKFTDEVQYGAFIITAKTKNVPDFTLFKEGNFLEEKAIKAYQNLITHQAQDERSYTYFWQPLAEKLKRIDKVYLSVDGVFNQVNMQALYNPQNEKYLFEEISLHLLTSGKELLAEKEIPMLNQYALLIGNPAFKAAPKKNDSEIKVSPVIKNLLASVERGGGLVSLPGTEREVRQISALLVQNQWRQETFLGAEAREEKLKDMLKPKVLHIATHGYFQDDLDDVINYNTNPLYRSGLLLSGAAKTLHGHEDLRGNVQTGKEDGILTAFEAMNLNIDNTDLVVLSACETGLGEIRNGEGVYGLQRAFKEAGARSILMSLWKVNDQTTNELMVAFYEYWLGGMSKREALKKAQATIKATYPHPYYWGAFVLIGE